MKDYISLGSVPVDEDCVQVSKTDDYLYKMKEECRKYMKQLEGQFPIPEGVEAHFTVKTFPHDFGPYCEVAIIFELDDDKSREFAYNIEDNLPEHWL